MPTGALLKALAVILAVIALLGALWGLYSAVDGGGHRRGVAERDAFWEAREAVQNASYAAEIKRLGEKAAAATQKGVTATAAAVQKLNLETKDALARKDMDISALHAGRLVLVDPGGSASCPAGGSAQGAAAADTAGGQPAAGGELSKPGAHVLSAEAAEFILTEAARADQVVAQLQAAQALLVSDREVCK